MEKKLASVQLILALRKIDKALLVKPEGQLVSIFLHEGQFGVCTKDLELEMSEAYPVWKTIRQKKLESIMKENSMDGYALHGVYTGSEIKFFEVINLETSVSLNEAEFQGFEEQTGLLCENLK